MISRSLSAFAAIGLALSPNLAAADAAQGTSRQNDGVDIEEVLAIQKLCFKATEGEAVNGQIFLSRGWIMYKDDGKGRRLFKHPQRKAKVILASTDNESCVVSAPAQAALAKTAYIERFSDLKWRTIENGNSISLQPHRIIGVNFKSEPSPNLNVHTIIRKNK